MVSSRFATLPARSNASTEDSPLVTSHNRLVSALIERHVLDWSEWDSGETALVEALDRYLHAPAALRPPPFVSDTQAVDADVRLMDPLDHRRR